MSTAYIYIALKRDVILLIMTHEKEQKEKALTADFVQLTLLLLWTSLGLNQGPPDYENDKMIFCDSQRF